MTIMLRGQSFLFSEGLGRGEAPRFYTTFITTLGVQRSFISRHYMISVMVFAAMLLSISVVLAVLHQTKSVDYTKNPRYPRELREAVREFLPVLKNVETVDDPRLLDIIHKNEHRHHLFRNVAMGLIYIKFHYAEEQDI